MGSPDPNTLPLDRTGRVPAPKAGMTLMVVRPSTAAQVQPEPDIPMAAAETFDFSCSKEPKSPRIVMPNYLGNVIKGICWRRFFDVIWPDVQHEKINSRTKVSRKKRLFRA